MSQNTDPGAFQRPEEAILILDFGGQYKQLIARRVRELSVYSEVKPCHLPIDEIRAGNYSGLILTGGPDSVNEDGAPAADPKIFELGIPVLGICYGAQYMAKALGGAVSKAVHPEYGRCALTLQPSSTLFNELPAQSECWMSHTDEISELPAGFIRSASSPACPNAAMEDASRALYAVQFHPEVEHTVEGRPMLEHFLYNICKVKGQWKMSSFVEAEIERIRKAAGKSKVLCALSGGVDSSVAAVLVHRAIGKNLTCIFVDHGLLRKDEGDTVERIFSQEFDLNLIRVNAADRFLGRLKGVTDPETKRKIIGEEFIRVFEDEAKKLGHMDYLVQGTIYPDVIESGVGGAVIKSHHNVGGLPDDIGFKGLIEPLRQLFKDEVRQAGLELGIPADLVWRQPFPGPGLAVRILGEVREDRLAILREADAIFREEVYAYDKNHKVGQYFAVLTDLRSVGVQGDARTYDYTLALRAVSTTDFMTADWVKLPWDLLERASNRIVNEVRGINRVVYDVTSKPPATIEWE